MNIWQAWKYYLPIKVKLLKAKFTYTHLGKTLNNQTKIIEEASKNQTKTIEDRAEKNILNTDEKLKSISNLFSKDFLAAEARDEFRNIKKIEQGITRDDLIYKTGNKREDKTDYFQKFKTIQYFRREIYSIFIALNDPFEGQVKN